MKAILAIIGLNIFFEHPFIVLGVIGVILYAAYAYRESQNENKNSETEENFSENDDDDETDDSKEIFSLVANKNLNQLSDYERELVYKYYIEKIHSPENNVKLSDDEKIFMAILMKKIMEYEDKTKMSDMQPIEREKIYRELNMYNEDPENLSENQQMRRGILSIKKLEYMAESTLPEDKMKEFMSLVLKKSAGETMTAKESREFEKLNSTVFDNFVED